MDCAMIMQDVFKGYSTSERFDEIVIYNAVKSFVGTWEPNIQRDMYQAVIDRYKECATLCDEAVCLLIDEMGTEKKNSDIKTKADAVAFVKTFVTEGKRRMEYLKDVVLSENELECLCNDVRELYDKFDACRL